MICHACPRMVLMSLLTLAGLAGCAAPVPPPADGAPLLARCGADRLVGLIGAPLADLPAPTAARTLRLLRPGDPVTEDFSETRLNVILDAGDRITAVSCG